MKFLKTTKSRLSIAIIMVMLLQVFMPMMGDIAWAGDGEGNDLGNIFTFDSFKVDGVEADENQLVEIKDGTIVKLDYTWKVTNASPGDFAEIDIPEAFKVVASFETPKPIILAEEQNVGTYKIVNNKLRFDFTEGINDVGGNVENGTLGFEVKFNEESFTEDVVEEIKFNDSGNKTITIIGKHTKTVESISKKGTPDSDKDAKNITWVVDIANPSDAAITDAKLNDLLPEGLKLDINSVEVNDLTIGLDGELNEGSEVSGLSPTINGQNFELDLPTIDPYKGYRIEYTTTITDKSISQFTNNASFEYGKEKLPANSTVTVERSADIEKDGEYIGYNEDKKYDEIEWWIDVNKSGGSIDNAIVEDTLPTGVTLVPESIEIFKLTQDGDNWTESDSGKTADEFPVTLEQIDDAYRIKFKTSIDYSKVNDGNYQKENSFKNEAILKDGEEKIGDAGKTVKITRKPILSKIGNSNVSYDDKTITWTVTVNEANHPIDNAIVTDTLPKGLTISKDDIEVKNSAGEVVTDKDKITVPTNDGSAPTEVTINLGDITEKYTIEYKTTITDFTQDEFENAASLGGKGVDTGGDEIIEPVYPAANELGKNFIGVNYAKKTISWESFVIPTREAVKTLKVTDAFPNDGLILLPDTLKVTIDGQEKTLDEHYTLEAIDNNYNKGFVVEFKEAALPIEKVVKISYDTSYDPEEGILENTGNGLYKNQVQFEGKTVNDNDFDQTRNAEHQVNDETVNTGKKEGKLISKDTDGNIVDGWVSGNERKIEWEVYTNYLKQNLGTEVTVDDVLGYEGVVDIDDIVVKEYSVAANGDTTLGDILDGEKYTATKTDEGFNLKFNENVSERYAIIFTTSVPDISSKTYTNTATTKVGDKKYPYTGSIGFEEWNKNVSKNMVDSKGNKLELTNVYTDDEINWNIKINEALSIIQKDVKIVDTISPGHVYIKDSLKVYKLKGTEKGEPLKEGYTLNQTTNDDDETVLTIQFTDSISSTYEIEYTTLVTATDGEVNNEVKYSGTNLYEKTVETKKLTASQSSYVGGDPAKGKIKVIKQDVRGETITTSQASFKLYYLLNGGKQYVINNSSKDPADHSEIFETTDGEVEIENLPLNRTYYLEEVKAPEGYVPATGRTEVEIKEPSSSKTYELEVINRKKVKTKSSIELIKKDDLGNALEGAVFGLFAKADTEFISPHQTATSNQEGKVLFKDVEKTDYLIKEIKAPEGYTLSDKVLEAKVASDNIHLELGEVENTKIKGSIEIIKQSADSGKPLAGAIFEVKDSNGMVVETVSTDKNGIAMVKDLKYGSYTIVESKAPRGYTLDGKIYQVEVNGESDEKNIEARLEIENTKDPDDPIWSEGPDRPFGSGNPHGPGSPGSSGLPKTGQGSDMLFYLGGLGFIGLGFAFRRKGRKA